MEYQDYLNSDKWKELSAQARQRANNACEFCGGSADHVHHVKYPENKDYSMDCLDNLVAVCEVCHKLSHGIRTEKVNNNDYSAPKHIKQVLGEVVSNLEKRLTEDNSITGLSTGFDDLDSLTLGLQKELIVIAGRPSAGKTTLAINIIVDSIIKNPQMPVIFFSLENSTETVMLRFISSLARIPFINLASGCIEDSEWERLTSAIHLLAATKLFIDDSSVITPSELTEKLSILKKEHGELGLVVVDYLQLMASNKTKVEKNLYEETAETSNCLRKTAKDFNCPVIALSQVNRNIEARADKRPLISDLLKGSQNIVSHAGTILFIYRDEIYNPDSLDKFAEVIVAKQRYGRLGTVQLNTRLDFCRFENFKAA
jgi:replicative DNA helicase